MKANPSISTLSWGLLLLIGAVAVLTGLGFLLLSQPWTLDRQANEKLLSMTFEQLFATAPTLPNYLVVLYRFFGLFLASFGLLLTVLAATSYRQGQSWAWWTVLLAVGASILVQTYLIVSFIPSSPFLWLDLGIVVLWAISLTLSAPKVLQRD